MAERSHRTRLVPQFDDDEGWRFRGKARQLGLWVGCSVGRRGHGGCGGLYRAWFPTARPSRFVRSRPVNSEGDAEIAVL